jgi:hypothetical protein
MIARGWEGLGEKGDREKLGHGWPRYSYLEGISSSVPQNSGATLGHNNLLHILWRTRREELKNSKNKEMIWRCECQLPRFDKYSLDTCIGICKDSINMYNYHRLIKNLK